MKNRLVCIGGDWDKSKPFPETGEIYTELVGAAYNKDYLCLVEFGANLAFRKKCFRPVDDTFGPAICETIEQQIELEKVLVTN